MIELKEIKEVIPDTLSAGHLQWISESLSNYQDIMLQIDSDKTSIASNEALKNQFARFYRFGAARQGAAFKQGYFEVMERIAREDESGTHQALTLGLILDGLEPYSRNIQRSFASKMLHTLRENEPIWDSVVLRHLGRKSSFVPGGTREARIMRGNEIYEQLQERYVTFLAEEKMLYKHLYGQLAEHPQCVSALAKRPISPTKLVDFILYSYRP